MDWSGFVGSWNHPEMGLDILVQSQCPVLGLAVLLPPDSSSGEVIAWTDACGTPRKLTTLALFLCYHVVPAHL